ncbi:acyl carrier protein [Streptomyces sp. Li-HN-5-11]|uniref:acyl carrier protein n=1 Tax=Streptomyces sp. Li-HN-5-11 TaxID=3075432 RepID=UPI0028AA77DC|nr:acyl carrier protein [Streptomyces sp. Li-HN-5-11]WNM31378.1 acyl carrier protein [Streptomyces sp. Li-HN-5-11]
MDELTGTQLMDIMRECSGEGEEVEAGRDPLDISFADLGYDSLALLETASRLERAYGIDLAEEDVAGARTPRALLELVRRTVAEAA